MKISYVTTYDSADVKNWSGLGYYISKALGDQNVEIDRIGNLNWNITIPMKIKARIYRLLGKEFAYERIPAIAKDLARQVSEKISKNSDLIFSPGSIPIAFLETSKPKVFCTDAVFAGMVGFYESFSNYSNETIQGGNLIDQTALTTCSLAIFSSDWAAETAISNYKVDRSKIKVVPFGANIEIDRTIGDIKNLITLKSKKECNLLFLGVEWERKGGDKAVKVAQTLNQRGIKTKLHIVGIKNPPLANIPDWIVNHGYVSKSSSQGKKIIDELFMKSHFLILPSIAEACAVVYSESNSFGVPIITTNVGGITTAVKNNLNGMAFPLETTVEEYADYIEKMLTNESLYRALALSSFNEFETRLNWKVAGKTIHKYLKEL